MGRIGTSRLRFGLQGGDLGLQARIWAFRLEFGPQDCNLGPRLVSEGGTKEKKKEKEKIPDMCESIGHRPLRSCCPKGCLSVSVLWKTKSGVCISQSVRANGALF